MLDSATAVFVLSAGLLLYFLFAKFSPMISIWEFEEGQQIALELDRLYDYMMNRLLEVTTKRDASGLAEVQRLLGTVRDAWAQAAAAPLRP